MALPVDPRGPSACGSGLKEASHMEIVTFPGFSGHLEASGVSDVTFDFFGSMRKGKCCRLLFIG